MILRNLAALSSPTRAGLSQSARCNPRKLIVPLLWTGSAKLSTNGGTSAWTRARLVRLVEVRRRLLLLNSLLHQQPSAGDPRVADFVVKPVASFLFVTNSR